MIHPSTRVFDSSSRGRWRGAPDREGGRRLLSFCCVALVLFALPLGAQTPGAGVATSEESSVNDWKDVEQLRVEQKFRAAWEAAQTLRVAAQEAGDDAGWTRGLIIETQLAVGLESYETAIANLRQRDWPDDPRYRTVLEMFYARSLVRYLQLHSWDVQQRERIELPEGELDLARLTGEQIYLEALNAYAGIWPQRHRWGNESLGELAEYIEQNNYPARIRGTLRDAVTYLWVELLADSSHWTAAQHNDLWRLDFAELLNSPGEGTEESLDLTDPGIHPLRKLTAIVGDLEAWHGEHHRPEAAFEARLERLRRLDASFSEASARDALQQDLEAHLEALTPGLPWRAMGQHQLATFLQRRGDLVAAHGVASEGARVHGESIGGQRCRALLKAIESPSFSLRSMTLDGPGQRSIQVQHKNLERLHFRVYPLPIDDELKPGKSRGSRPNDTDMRRLLAKETPLHRWTEDLPATPDYQAHQTYVTPPMTSLGRYVVVASSRADFVEAQGAMQAVVLTLSDLVMATQAQADGLEVTVRSGRSGERLAGVEMALYQQDWNQGPQRLAVLTSDAKGRASFEMADDSNRRRRNVFVVARRGDDVALARDVPRYWRSSADGGAEQALIYTDRSVYRPGQTLKWKVVAYRRDADSRRLQVAPQSQVSITLLDANGEELTTVDAETNDFGSAAGEMEIPTGRLLGSWHLRSTPNAYATIQVEEYKRPTFEVSLDDPAEALRLNEPATLAGEARYYFGLPVTEGEAVWRVLRQPVYPPWWGWFRPFPGGGSQTVAVGSSPLGPDGRFELHFTPEVKTPGDDELSKQLSYSYRVEVDVVNDGGETRSTQRSFRLGHVAIEASVEGQRAFFLDSEKVGLTIARRDLDGLPRAGTGTWQLLAVKQPDEAPLPAEQPTPQMDPDGYQTPGDQQRPRWESSQSWQQIAASWPDGQELRRGDLVHGDDGRAELTTGSLRSGLYRLRYRTEDAFGMAFSTSYDFIVAGQGCKNIRLPLLLLADRPSAAVGESVRVLVHSGLRDQGIAYELNLGDERRIDRRYDSDDGLQLIEVDVDSAMRGNFEVRAELVRDHQVVAQDVQLEVPWNDRRLRLELATFRDRLRPGQEETWKVILRGAEGEALEEGAAELLAYMYDRSLDIFSQHTPPRILQLYQRRVHSRYLRYNLGEGRTIWRRQSRPSGLAPQTPLRGDQLKFYDEYMFGGPGRFGGGRVMKMAAAMPEGAVVLESRAMAQPAPAPPMERAFADASPQQAEADDLGGVVAGIPEPAPQDAAPVEVRSNFAETAFWHPQLRLEADGAVSFTFQVPDSVTEWNLWLHAMTRDLRSASEQRQVRTVKELLVRPYLPRFFRQMDRPELRVVIDNAGEADLEGTLDLELFDVESEVDLRQAFGLTAEQTRHVPFAVAAGQSTRLTFPVAVPRRLGEVALRVVGRAGDWSDGELRPLPVLPSRLHLSQSRFATLHDEATRRLHFADLEADDDPSRQTEQLVVTVDGQLFYSVLHALPYLVKYPYNCTEQTLNRFLSTGIVSSLYGSYPAVARMAEQFAQRQTPLEPWDEDDPNRKMLLEESPWLSASRGGRVADGAELINVLDPRLTEAARQQALEELRQSQTADGGFPWWSGGPPSPYITAYTLMGLSRALEFGVDVPQDMVQSAWGFLHQHYRRKMAKDLAEGRCCVELATLLNFTLSSYPDLSWTGGLWSEDDRRAMLDTSFDHWPKLSPLLKGYLALTLARQGRADDATLVWESVMDSAREEPDQGIFWAPEERSWLWYNDSVEGHAFALRVLSELSPDDPRRHGLVQWLLLNKKLGHWKSTRATAEAIYGLVHYLKQEGGIARREEAEVRIGDQGRRFVFEPDTYTGRKNQWQIPGEAVDPTTMSSVVVHKETPGFLFASATWHYATDRLPERAEGDFFQVERQFFRRHHDGDAWRLEPWSEVATVEPGDQVEVHLTVRAKQAAEYVHLRDPRGAGFEPVDLTSGYRWDLGLGHYREIRDSGTNFFIEWLPAGEYVLKYRLRAALGGDFRVGPATLQSMYAPEFVAFSSGAQLRIEGGSSP